MKPRWPIILCLSLLGCVSGKPDYETINRELELAVVDLAELQALVTEDDPELGLIFASLGDIVVSVQIATEGAEGGVTVLEAIHVGLAATQNLLITSEDLSDKDQVRAEAAIFVFSLSSSSAGGLLFMTLEICFWVTFLVGVVIGIPSVASKVPAWGQGIVWALLFLFLGLAEFGSPLSGGANG